MLNGMPSTYLQGEMLAMHVWRVLPVLCGETAVAENVAAVGRGVAVKINQVVVPMGCK